MGPTRRSQLLLAHAVCALSFAARTQAQTAATWLNSVGGTWDDATKWSTNPQAPKNGFPTASDSYTATIAATGAPYLISQFNPTTLSAFTLDSPDATAQFTSLFSVIGAFNVNRGTLIYGDPAHDQHSIDPVRPYTGSIAGSSAGAVVFNSGAFSAFSVSPQLTIAADAAGVIINNGLTLNNTSASILLGNSQGISGVTFSGNQTLGGSASILFASGNSYVGVTAGTLTLGPAISLNSNSTGGTLTIEKNAAVINNGSIAASSFGIFQIAGSLGSFTNNGSISESSGSTPAIQILTPMVNHGLIQSALGGSIEIHNLDNTGGTIRSNGGSIFLSGVEATSQLGTLDGSSGKLYIAGNLNNSGATLTANAATGNLYISGTISAGTLTTNDGAQFNIDRNATLSALTLSGAMSIYNGFATIPDSLTLSGGTIQLGATGLGTGELDLGTSLAGTGQILFTGASTFGSSVRASFATTIASGISIRTSTDNGTITGSANLITNFGLISAETPSKQLTVTGVTNKGTLQAINSSTLSFDGPNQGTILAASGGTVALVNHWDNSAGTINASGGTVHLDGTFAPTNLGTINNTGGTIAITGTFNNTGNTLALNASTGSWNTGANFGSPSAIITGGVISTADTAKLLVTGITSFSAVHLIGTAYLGATTLSLQSGFTLDGTFLCGDSATAGSTLTLYPQTISGAGQFIFNANPKTFIDPEGNLTFAGGISFRTGSGSANIGSGANVMVVNNGIISAETPGQSITLNGSGPLTNNGTLQAVSGATLTISSTWSSTGSIILDNSTLNLGGFFTPASLVTISRNGGMINITGNLNASGSTFTLNSAIGPLNLTTALVTGGVINSDGTPITALPGGSTLTNLTLNVPFTIAGGVVNAISITNAGTITLLSNGISFSGAWSNTGIIDAHSGTSLTFAGTPLSFGTVSLSSATLTLDATATSATLRQFHSTASTIKVLSPGVIDNTADTLNLNSDEQIILASGRINGGTVSSTDGTQLVVSGVTSTVNGVTLAADTLIKGSSTLSAITSLMLSGATITLQPTAAAPAVLIGSGITVQGSGKILFAGTAPSILRAAGAGLTLGPFTLVQTSGQGGTIGASGIPLTTQGTISATTSAKTVGLLGSSVTNTGVVTAGAGATIQISAPLTWTAGSIGGDGAITTSNVTVSNSVQKTGSGPLKITGNLTLNSGATFDLNLGDLILDYSGASPISAIRSLLSSGFNVGTWNGTGIASSAAGADSSHLTSLAFAESSDLGLSSFDGQAVDATSLLIKYTYYGDNNLDGSVTTVDFQMFLDGLATSGSTWSQGDYTYDGKVDLGNDFNLFLVSYLSQGGALGDLAPIIAGDAQLSTAQRAQLLSVVPEPVSIGLLGCGAVLAIAHRQRAQRIPAR